MKLAEALALRADYNRRISMLRERILRNAKVQEGENSPEDPMELLAQAEDLEEKLEELCAHINLTNSKVTFEGKTMTELLAKRDGLLSRITTYRRLVDSASNLVDRYSKSEIKVYSNVDVKSLQKKVDDLSMEHRQLNFAIQELNWTNELC